MLSLARPSQGLLVGHLFHPVDDLAVELFLKGDMGHGRRCRSSMPVLFLGCEPDNVARPDCLDRAALALHPSASGSHYQRLTKRMGVPCGAGPGLERYMRTG